MISLPVTFNVVHGFNPAILDSYDFIVVGCGTAGSVVANRLSENGKHSVLILEAGGYPNPALEVPVFGSKFWNDPKVVRSYPVVQQRHAALANSGNITMLVGRMLGGTSSISNSLFNRASPHDFNNWAKMTGDDSWKYDNLLPYFRKSENYVGDFPSEQHGFGGPITVSRPQYAPGLDVWLAAGKELGYSIADSNGPQQTSFHPIESHKKFGKIVSSYTGYIKPIQSARRNLKIVTNSQATKIVFKGGKAIGIDFVTESTSAGGLSRQGHVRARREIIVSAGALGSPTLLMKSGIGPRDVLTSARIPIVKELPVGRNLFDHVLIHIPFVINNKSLIYDPQRDLNSDTWKIYKKFGDGPYSTNFGASGQAFISSVKTKREGNIDWPDIQIIPFHARLPGNLLDLGSMAEWEAPMLVQISLVRPKTRGKVVLDPHNVNGSPLIDLQYLSHPADAQVLLDGIKKTLQIFERTEAYKRLGARLPTLALEPCKNFKFRSNDYWKCYIRNVATSGFHLSGSCKMGKGDDDRKAVVDSNLRVIGINGLRIIDASIMPGIVNADLIAPVLAIAEKVSESILRNHV
ncbi:Oxygen-dependent choline dehydrogenase [Orchesella cincta]|uniref:Oxygen-dependent choline dehydrogenase n=1 Tax=Orchesella cincta TaxID=48709 RepID=A0A1D2NB85_ORCCI|nr:Oxygen-dependent choline dehydrogenase [Orchesella cincta]